MTTTQLLERDAAETITVLPSRRPSDPDLFFALHVALEPTSTAAVCNPAGPAEGSSWWMAAWITVLLVVLSTLGVKAVQADEPAGPNPVACPPVRYRVDVDHAPPSAAGDVRVAFDRVSQATGLTFIDAGKGEGTAKAGAAEPAASIAPGTVLISWASELDSNPHRIGTATSHRDHRGVTGRVVLNAAAEYPGGFETRKSWGGVLLHEFGHLVGLDHTESRDELMYPRVIDGPAQWGPDDRRKLAEAGRALGCVAPALS